MPEKERVFVPDRPEGAGEAAPPPEGAVRSATQEQLSRCCEGARWAFRAAARAYRVGGNELGTADEEFEEDP